MKKIYFIYFYYDDAGDLLYIGKVSRNTGVRAIYDRHKEHIKRNITIFDKHFNEAAFGYVLTLPSESAMNIAEQYLTGVMHPKYDDTNKSKTFYDGSAGWLDFHIENASLFYTKTNINEYLKEYEEAV